MANGFHLEMEEMDHDWVAIIMNTMMMVIIISEAEKYLPLVPGHLCILDL